MQEKLENIQESKYKNQNTRIKIQIHRGYRLIVVYRLEPHSKVKSLCLVNSWKSEDILKAIDVTAQ